VGDLELGQAVFLLGSLFKSFCVRVVENRSVGAYGSEWLGVVVLWKCAPILAVDE